MSGVCGKLHEILWEGRRYRFGDGFSDVPKNGVYVLFEKGESGHGGDRIVRIGTHTGENQLPSRLFQHFENPNKNRSIFRKNVGRCLLNMREDDYLSVWNYDTTTALGKQKYRHMVNPDKERALEREISHYIQQNFSFVLLAVQGKLQRLTLESLLIGTVSNCKQCSPSESWLGLHSPVDKIRNSGLWQVMELCSTPLEEGQLSQLLPLIVR